MNRCIPLVAILAVALLVGLSTPLQAAETATGKVKTVNATAATLTITDADSKDWSFTCATDFTLLIDGNAAKLDALKTGMEVMVTYRTQGGKLIATEIRHPPKK